MPLLTNKTTQARPNLDNMRRSLRQRLIAARGSSYTYKDPDSVAARAGGTIGRRGTIRIPFSGSENRPQIFRK